MTSCNCRKTFDFGSLWVRKWQNLPGTIDTCWLQPMIWWDGSVPCPYDDSFNVLHPGLCVVGVSPPNVVGAPLNVGSLLSSVGGTLTMKAETFTLPSVLMLNACTGTGDAILAPWPRVEYAYAQYYLAGGPTGRTVTITVNWSGISGAWFYTITPPGILFHEHFGFRLDIDILVAAVPLRTLYLRDSGWLLQDEFGNTLSSGPKLPGIGTFSFNVTVLPNDVDYIRVTATGVTNPGLFVATVAVV